MAQPKTLVVEHPPGAGEQPHPLDFVEWRRADTRKEDPEMSGGFHQQPQRNQMDISRAEISKCLQKGI